MRGRYGLLPDTKLRKNIPQQIIRRDLSRDLAQVMQGAADVDGEEIAGDAVSKPLRTERIHLFF